VQVGWSDLKTKKNFKEGDEELEQSNHLDSTKISVSMIDSSVIENESSHFNFWSTFLDATSHFTPPIAVARNELKIFL
jgi:hypothetical protein